MYEVHGGLIHSLKREGRSALAGAIAVGVGFGVSELYSGVITGGPSLIVAVGNAVIDLAPEWVKDFVIAVFGTHDKLVLAIAIVVLGVGVGVLLGVGARRRSWVGPVGFLMFGFLAVAAGIADDQISSISSILGGAVAVVAGIWALVVLRHFAMQDGAPRPVRDARLGNIGRRSFLRLAGVLATVAVGTAVGGRILIERARTIAASRDDVVLPHPSEPAVSLPVGSTLHVDGISPLITPNQDFYRIDTAFAIPRIDLQTWTLKVEGLVDRPFEISYTDLLDMPQVERYITLCCVSNEVGGDLVGNARWQGVRLTDLLDLAGVQPTATQVVGLSVDGFTAGFPLALAYDTREALVALGMNGVPLPMDHGFPARLVISGLYGYVSATKWLDAIILNRLEDFDAYWIPRGWAKKAPIKTQSRIDVPKLGKILVEGEHMVAGVAWAQPHGVTKVEVQIDSMDWREANLAEEITGNTWRQWVLPWNAVPGSHVLRVRATDATGQTQTHEDQSPDPDGATGYHTVVVDVIERST